MNRLGYLALLLLAFLALPLAHADSPLGGNVLVSNAVVTVSISPGSGSIIAQNTMTWTATVLPSKPPYTYVWNLYNFAGTLNTTTTYSSCSLTTNTFSYAFNYGQKWYANVVVTDAVPNTASSANSVITVCYPSCSGVSSGSLAFLSKPTTITIQNNWTIAAVGVALMVGIISAGVFYTTKRKPKKEEKEKKA